VAALFVCRSVREWENQLDYESQEITWSIAVMSRTVLRCRARNAALFEEQSGKYLGIGAGCRVSIARSRLSCFFAGW
jgi:glutaredoxin-related protein